MNVLQATVRTTDAAKTGKMASFFNLFPARRKNKGELRKEMPFLSGTGAFFQIRKKARCPSTGFNYASICAFRCAATRLRLHTEHSAVAKTLVARTRADAS